MEAAQPEEPPLPAAEVVSAIDGQDHDRMLIDTMDIVEPHPDMHIHQQPLNHSSESIPRPVLPSIADLLTPPPQALIAVQSDLQTPIPEAPTANPTDGTVDVSERERSATESSTDSPQTAGDDSDDDDYDGHVEFLDHLKEDASTPTEEELEEMRRHTYKSALEHEHWETAVYTSLDDPEYVPGEYGCIHWVLQGFHGTKQNPNKKRIMRSPTVVIGGYKWNIKVFPRGHDGTDQISVYVECSGEASEDSKEMETIDVQEGVTSNQQSGEAKNAGDAMNEPPSVDSKPWDVAAQMGCVMYNPEEPRVFAFEKATHHYENVRRDWGWTRFHGPWSTIHQRRHLQWKAMLQNDTLALTAYVRVVKDPTKALWWRPADQGSWDSIVKTGYRGLEGEEPDADSFTAALALWFHIKPFQDLVLHAALPDSARDPLARPTPLIQHLQQTLYNKHSPIGPSSPIILAKVQKIFDWYGVRFMDSPDVIQVFESLRYIVNAEMGSSSTRISTDVLGFIKTIRQNITPTLPTGSDRVSQPQGANQAFTEPHSVQELLNEVSNRDSKQYKDWGGIEHGSDAETDVLQVELHRQKYDAINRKWTKLTHEIKLNENVMWSGTQYTLFGVVIHKGKLGSGRFYSIVRPGGPNARWVRYKSTVTTYLTHRQAIECHEGKGVYREGAESVAYLAIYVKSDKLTTLVPIPEDKSESGVLGPLTRPESNGREVPDHENITAIVHDSSAFHNYAGTGFVDPWSANPSELRYEINLPSTACLSDVQKALVSEFKVAVKPAQCRLWPLDASVDNARNMPCLEGDTPNTILAEIAAELGGVHLWLHVIPLELVPEEPPTPSNAVNSPSHSVSAPTPAPQPVPPTVSRQDSNQDIVMGGTQEHENTASLPVPGRTEALAPLPPVEPQWPLQDQVYFFVKVFDPESQQVRGVGCFFATRHTQISKTLPSELASKSYKILHEIENLDSEESEISPDATLSSANLHNGSIIILVIDLNCSEEHEEELRQQGYAIEAPEFFSRLTLLAHYLYRGDHYDNLFFGGGYKRAPLRDGALFGLGTEINTYGDAYEGNFAGGNKVGRGTMYYANGDVYTGDWVNSLPEGQGEMVYAPHGNKHVGGWKAGRRHGKGITTWEVTDEDVELCHICYSAEMDTVFLSCGHFAWCSKCARQVQECPLCRRPVDKVARVVERVRGTNLLFQMAPNDEVEAKKISRRRRR